VEELQTVLVLCYQSQWLVVHLHFFSWTDAVETASQFQGGSKFASLTLLLESVKTLEENPHWQY
jgi:hypothetical protein